MLRRLVTVLAVLATAGVVVPSSPAPAPAAPAMARWRSDYHRQYGGLPVILNRSDRRVRIHFDGQRGDRVRLDDLCRTLLRDPGGARVDQRANGYWRLPAAGSYTFVHLPCVSPSPWVRHPVYRHLPLRLIKLVAVRPLKVGSSVVLDERRGFEYAARVSVPQTGRVQLAGTAADGSRAHWRRLVLPGGRIYTATDCLQDDHCEVPGTVHLEAGRPIGGKYGAFSLADQPLPVAAGDRVLLVARQPMRLHATVARTVAASVDGPPVVASANRYQEVAVSFDGTAGQWVRLTTDAGSDAGNVRLLGPDGTQYLSAWSGFDFWQLPATGRYAAMLAGGDKVFAATVAVRSVRLLAQPLPLDGTPLTVTATTPGEWVVAPVAAGPGSYRLNGTASGVGSGWFGYAEGPRYLCPINGGLGCGDGTHVYVDASTPQSLAGFGVGQAIALVGFPAGQSGSVTLSLSPWP